MDRPGGPSAAADDDLTPRRTSPPRFRGISFIVAESDPGLDPSETTSEEDHDGTSTPLGATGPVAKHHAIFVVTTTAADAPAVQEAVRHDLLERAAAVAPSKGGRRRRGKFSDLVFTRTFSAFDRHNPEANNIFHGFFTLFCMAVFLLS
ncbi:hypothetical protein B0T25DRAFT_570764 [Lasiosphaeria hispida]|uniref:Uncharacterized protein n=1 Tax=Lasiosphaeria hispida TaxID=260671 RepID=A0AAJ0HG09_9PEZI|nr:hypothetical protein B0T25DRAFT_570764 [Lasiosphaeria hispida]